jgi:hypothetical protein
MYRLLQTELSVPSLPTNVLYKLSWILKLQVLTIVDSVLLDRSKSLKQLADVGNKGLSPFANSTLTKGWKLCQLLLIDFPAVILFRDVEHSGISSAPESVPTIPEFVNSNSQPCLGIPSNSGIAQKRN